MASNQPEHAPQEESAITGRLSALAIVVGAVLLVAGGIDLGLTQSRAVHWQTGELIEGFLPADALALISTPSPMPIPEPEPTRSPASPGDEFLGVWQGENLTLVITRSDSVYIIESDNPTGILNGTFAGQLVDGRLDVQPPILGGIVYVAASDTILWAGVQLNRERETSTEATVEESMSQDAAPVLAAEAMSPDIPVEGMAMGPADAPVTIVEWGDYT